MLNLDLVVIASEISANNWLIANLNDEDSVLKFGVRHWTQRIYISKKSKKPNFRDKTESYWDNVNLTQDINVIKYFEEEGFNDNIHRWECQNHTLKIHNRNYFVKSYNDTYYQTSTSSSYNKMRYMLIKSNSHHTTVFCFTPTFVIFERN